jgi:hypothetical protein
VGNASPAKVVTSIPKTLISVKLFFAIALGLVRNHHFCQQFYFIDNWCLARSDGLNVKLTVTSIDTQFLTFLEML